MKLKLFLTTITVSASSLVATATPSEGMCPQPLKSAILCTSSQWSEPNSIFNFEATKDCELIVYVVTDLNAYSALKFNDENLAMINKVIDKEDTAAQNSVGIRILDEVNYVREGFISAGVKMNAALPVAKLKNKLVLERFQQALDKKSYIVIRDSSGQAEDEMTYVERFELGAPYPANTCESNPVVQE